MARIIFNITVLLMVLVTLGAGIVSGSVLVGIFSGLLMLAFGFIVAFLVGVVIGVFK